MLLTTSRDGNDNMRNLQALQSHVQRVPVFDDILIRKIEILKVIFVSFKKYGTSMEI
jgi:hypothetical protein